ncbi:chromosome segregation protein SMC [Haliscomenobacter sp.]|uniref:chromosome segregation protein SMC n=1 Tax=Haliscomenobacter sp. TaxID=2717303 RepID=UPI003BA89BF8
MRLKSLEIKGFKSFANPTVINFAADVIGIVGPNGSGKSNVVDAIRWVLGEQSSRELRLDQMSSVIFNGTKKRKPAGIAQVSLTFENTKNLLPTEYNTVTITRMLYRSGESEYRLNGVTCRLKDITGLFLDTGIGSNSYAIIALGMVDDILEDKEDSRRKMFEQAAGVSKYKLRKKETLSKLKSTSEDLERIEDLLAEIESNLKSLEKQAKRTQKYFELKEEYKQLSVALALIKVGSLKEKHKTLQSQIDLEQDNYRQIDVESRNLEANLEKERLTHLDKEKALSERQRDLNSLVGRIRGMENDRRMLEQKQQFVQQNRQKLEQDIQQAQGRIVQLEEDIEHYRSELNVEKRVEARLEQELESAEQQLDKIRGGHGAMKADLDVVVQEQQKLERAINELEKQKAISLNQIDNHHNDLNRNDAEIRQRQESVSGLRNKVQELETQERVQQDAVTLLEQAEEKRQQDLQKGEAELSEITQKIARVRRDLDAKRNEYKLTKSMVENLEGFPESIQYLVKSKDWDKGAPLLSDLIYVSEEYRVAIENYLEPYLNYFVVNNLEEAYFAIELLGKTQKGKANFFVLDAFRDYQMPMTLLPETKMAIELVQTDPAYRNLVSYLLENVLLTEKEEVSGALPDQDVVVLSRSGRIIKRRFSVSGGSIGLFEGKKIGRKKNLEVLEEAIKKAEQEENRLSTSSFNLKERVDALKAKRPDLEMQQQRSILNKLAQEKVSLATSLSNFESLIQEVSNRRELTEQRIKELQVAVGETEAQLTLRYTELDAVKEKISQTDGSFRQMADQLSQASAAFNDKNIQFIRQQNKVNTFQQELTFREKQITDTKNALQQNQQGILTADREITVVADELVRLAGNLQTAYAERGVHESSLTEAEQVYFKARTGMVEMEDRLRKLSRQQSDLQVLINNLKDKFNDVKFEISSISQRLRIEFEIGINDILNEEPSIKRPEAELQEEVDKLKKRLDNYGEINPMAVEAYTEIKERYDNIAQQRDDIVAAKKSLEQTILEIEETATRQFLEAFEKARLYFIDVFRSLFTEDDNCDLILLDPDNPLDSRIEIVAKPKGKRPQTISQLSGGEKTLTATALLFALYLLKPAPFCIFDEVDAPLDDGNITKFNRIIKKFSKDSQFIIVTHNKLTMAAVDTIYGVYMAEQGVSGVMPVDFRDYENVGGQFEVAVG